MNDDGLIRQFEMTSDVARNLREAAEALAWNANGTQSHMMPAPTTYELLGHIKLALGHRNEAAAVPPRGLRQSLDNLNITITDRDFMTGQARGTEKSVNLACQTLFQLRAALVTAATSTESAQGAINSQGYGPVSTNQVPTLAGKLSV